MAVEVVSSVPSSPPSSAEGLAPMSAKGLVSACGKAVVEGSWRTDVVVADGDTGAVDLVDGAVDELEVERVRDHLVAADDILQVESALSSGFRQEGLSCQRARASRVEQGPLQQSERRTLKISILAVVGCVFGEGKGEAAGQEKDCCTLGGGVLLFLPSFPSFCGEKIGVWPLHAAPDRESAALGPPQRLCRPNLLPRLGKPRCKIFDSLLCAALCSFLPIHPAANP